MVVGTAPGLASPVKLLPRQAEDPVVAAVEGSVLEVLGPTPPVLRRPPDWVTGRGVHVDLLVDGRFAADLWPWQVATVAVAPGPHRLCLRRPSLRSESVVEVPEGETVEMAVSPWSLFSGLTTLQLRPATARDRVLIAALVGDPAPGSAGSLAGVGGAASSTGL